MSVSQTTPARSGSAFSDLRIRVLSATVLAAAAVSTLLLGSWPFVLFWLAASLAILWEWQRLIGGTRLGARLLVGGAALSFAAALCVNQASDLAAIVMGLASLPVGALAGPGRRLWAGAGVFYAGVLIVSVAMIRPALAASFEHPFDVRTIVGLFAVVWGTDIAAYFAGRVLGGPKVWPAVSAGKTWSGTLVGVGCGALAGLAVAAVNAILPVSFGPLFLVGLAAAASSQAGDFLESGVKRRFGVKDSSGLIPGHGGVMDRLDGFVAAAAFVVVLSLLRDVSSVGEAVFRW